MDWIIILMWLAVIAAAAAGTGYLLRNRFSGMKTDIIGTVIAIAALAQSFDWAPVFSGLTPQQQGLALFAIAALNIVLRRITDSAATWSWVADDAGKET